MLAALSIRYRTGFGFVWLSLWVVLLICDLDGLADWTVLYVFCGALRVRVCG